MNGTIVAINRQLGTLVVETIDKKCAVLETFGRITANIGDQIEGEWIPSGPFSVNNVTSGERMNMTLQDADISRYEAVGRMTVI